MVIDLWRGDMTATDSDRLDQVRLVADTTFSAIDRVRATITRTRAAHTLLDLETLAPPVADALDLASECLRDLEGVVLGANFAQTRPLQEGLAAAGREVDDLVREFRHRGALSGFRHARELGATLRHLQRLLGIGRGRGTA
jgi:hypothetical protein